MIEQFDLRTKERSKKLWRGGCVAYDDLSDDPRLSQGLEEEDEGAGGENNKGELKDEEREGKFQRVVRPLAISHWS